MGLVNCNINLLAFGGAVPEEVIPNQPPVNVTPGRIIQGGIPITQADAGTVVTASVGLWTGTPVITYTYQWRRNGVNITNAFNFFLNLLDAWIGDDIDCVITATNAFGVASQPTLNPIEVIAVPINNVVPPSISGPAGEGGTLICNGGTWTGSAITFTFQWRKNGVNIGGATAGVYVTLNSDVGASIDVVVTATNTLGAVSVPSSNQIIVTTTAPVNDIAPVGSGYNQVGQVVSSTNGTWHGTPVISFTYQWLRDGVPIAGATMSTYVIIAPDVSKDIVCRVTATNGIGSTSADSNVISPIPPLDPDAAAYIAAEGITDVTEIIATNTLFVSLKSAGIYSLCKAMYLYLGTCTLNAINPVNSDAANRLVYSGGWTFGAGALPNGIDAWANTFLDCGYFNSETGISMATYLLTPKVKAGAVYWQGNQGGGNIVLLYNNGAGLSGVWCGDGSNQLQWADTATTIGYRGGSRTRNVSFNTIKRVSFSGSATFMSGNLNPVVGGVMYVGALNNSGTPAGFSDQGLGFTWFGVDMSSAQLVTLRNLVTNFNNTLGR